MVVDEVLERREDAVPEARLVGAAGRGGNQVDVGFAHRRAFLRPRHGPGCAFAGGKSVVALGGEFFAGKQRNQRFVVEGLGEVAAHAVLEMPAAGFAAFDGEADFEAGHQHGLGAQKAFEFGAGQLGRVEVSGVGPGAHAGAAGLFGGVADAGEGFDHVAAGKHQLVAGAVAHHFHFEPVRQRVGDRDAHAVKAARKSVGGIFVGFVELAAGVKPGEHHFNGRHAFNRVDFHRDAAAVVGDADRAVEVQGDADLLAEAGHRFVGGVVDDFLDDVERVLGAGVHARPLLDRLEALENCNRIGVICFLRHAETWTDEETGSSPAFLHPP